MTIPSEDKGIVLERQRLERFWLQELTSGQRVDWLNWWEDYPPEDISGKSYVPTAPTLMDEVLVTQETCYAWSQIYATYRFRLPALADRPAQSLPLPVVPTVSAGTDQLEVLVENVDESDTPQRVIIYATKPGYVGQFTPKYNLRPIEWFTQRALPYTFEITERYLARFNSLTEGLTLHVRAAIIGADNSHVIAADIVSQEISA